VHVRNAQNTQSQPSATNRTIILLEETLARLRPGLEHALGASYRVLPPTAISDAAAAVVPPDHELVERLRESSPQLLIVVYDTANGDPAPFLEGQADDHAGRCSMPELAARLRAGLRRLEWHAPGD
jgi:hypothetical protein